MKNKSTLEEGTTIQTYREPSFLEVAKKISGGIKQSIPSTLENIVTSAPCEFVKNFVQLSSGIAIIPYIFPSALKALDALSNDEEISSTLKKFYNLKVNNFGGFAGAMLGIPAGVGSYIVQVPVWMALANKYGYSLLAVPVLTNCASGIYEWYKEKKNQMIKEDRRKFKEANMIDLSSQQGR